MGVTTPAIEVSPEKAQTVRGIRLSLRQVDDRDKTARLAARKCLLKQLYDLYDGDRLLVCVALGVTDLSEYDQYIDPEFVAFTPFFTGSIRAVDEALSDFDEPIQAEGVSEIDTTVDDVRRNMEGQATGIAPGVKVEAGSKKPQGSVTDCVMKSCSLELKGRVAQYLEGCLPYLQPTEVATLRRRPEILLNLITDEQFQVELAGRIDKIYHELAAIQAWINTEVMESSAREDFTNLTIDPIRDDSERIFLSERIKAKFDEYRQYMERAACFEREYELLFQIHFALFGHVTDLPLVVFEDKTMSAKYDGFFRYISEHPVSDPLYEIYYRKGADDDKVIKAIIRLNGNKSLLAAAEVNTMLSAQQRMQADKAVKVELMADSGRKAFYRYLLHGQQNHMQSSLRKMAEMRKVMEELFLVSRVVKNLNTFRDLLSLRNGFIALDGHEVPEVLDDEI